MALFLLLFLLLFLCIWSGTTAEGVGHEESKQFMKWDTLPARDNMSIPEFRCNATLNQQSSCQNIVFKADLGGSG